MNRTPRILVITLAAALWASVSWAPIPPEGRLDFYSEQTGVKFPADVQLEEGRPVTVTVDDATKLNKIITDETFSCQKGEKIQMKFTSTTSAMMLLSKIDKVAVFTFKDEEWRLKKLDSSSAWRQ